MGHGMWDEGWDDELAHGDEWEPGRADDGEMSAWDALLRNELLAGGVAVVGAREWEGHPQYTYTVGLWACAGHPELLVSGLDAFEWYDEVIPLTAEVRRGRRLEPFEEVSLGERHPRCVLVPVADPAILISAQEHFGGSRWRPVTAFQVVWADDEGHWPWDTGWHLEPQELFGAPADAA